MTDYLHKLYQKECNYTITSNTQEIEFEFNVARLKAEMLQFIIEHDYGLNVVSLRLPEGNTNWTSSDEILETNAIDDMAIAESEHSTPFNTRPNSEYLNWHPALDNSYVKDLVPQIEKVTGFKIGRIRLGWVLPNNGYPMHSDLDPMRLHIPLVTNKHAYIVNDDKLHHFSFGKLYHLLSTETHTAHNFGRVPRLHLVFSTYGSSEIDNEMLKISSTITTEQRYLDHVKDCNFDVSTVNALFRIVTANENTADALITASRYNKIVNLIKQRK